MPSLPRCLLGTCSDFLNIWDFRKVSDVSGLDRKRRLKLAPLHRGPCSACTSFRNLYLGNHDGLLDAWILDLKLELRPLPETERLLNQAQYIFSPFLPSHQSDQDDRMHSILGPIGPNLTNVPQDKGSDLAGMLQNWNIWAKNTIAQDLPVEWTSSSNQYTFEGCSWCYSTINILQLNVEERTDTYTLITSYCHF